MSSSNGPTWDNLRQPSHVSKRVLITVKAYPNPSNKYVETVCVAGLTDDGQWIRLYPVQYRALAADKQFRLYNWVNVQVRKSGNDPRPESYKVDPDSIEVNNWVGTSNAWAERRRLLLPHLAPSLEYLDEQRRLNKTSLGMIRPKMIRRLRITSDESEWSPRERIALRRQTWLDALDADSPPAGVIELEKIPFRFAYQFECDDARCRGHDLQIIAWEVKQSYRNFRKSSPEHWRDKFIQKYDDELIHRRDLHFYVGNLAQHQHRWNILGLFYPPRLIEKEIIQPRLL